MTRADRWPDWARFAVAAGAQRAQADTLRRLADALPGHWRQRCALLDGAAALETAANLNSSRAECVWPYGRARRGAADSGLAVFLAVCLGGAWIVAVALGLAPVPW